jgi:hypothetical protein
MPYIKLNFSNKRRQQLLPIAAWLTLSLPGVFTLSIFPFHGSSPWGATLQN